MKFINPISLLELNNIAFKEITPALLKKLKRKLKNELELSGTDIICINKVNYYWDQIENSINELENIDSLKKYYQISNLDNLNAFLSYEDLQIFNSEHDIKISSDKNLIEFISRPFSYIYSNALIISYKNNDFYEFKKIISFKPYILDSDTDRCYIKLIDELRDKTNDVNELTSSINSGIKKCTNKEIDDLIRWISKTIISKKINLLPHYFINIKTNCSNAIHSLSIAVYNKLSYKNKALELIQIAHSFIINETGKVLIDKNLKLIQAGAIDETLKKKELEAKIIKEKEEKERLAALKKLDEFLAKNKEKIKREQDAKDIARLSAQRSTEYLKQSIPEVKPYYQAKSSTLSTKTKNKIGGWVFMILGIVLYQTCTGIIHSHNNDNTQISPTAKQADTSTLNPTVSQTTPVITEPAPIQPYISPYKGNQLKNGSAPLNKYFGHGEYGGNAWIKVINNKFTDAIICVVNSTTNEVVRNSYIRSNHRYTIKNVPTGTYYLKVYYGNDWNPRLLNILGKRGAFESDVRYVTANDSQNYITLYNNDFTYSTETIKLDGADQGNVRVNQSTEGDFYQH